MKHTNARRITAALFGITAILAPTSAAHADTVSDEAAFVAAINVSRAAAGLKPLAVHPELVEVSRVWSSGMSKKSEEVQARDENDRFKCTIFHVENLGATMKTEWLDIGENVGCADATPAAMHEAFMNSPKHRANILDPVYNYVGIGIVRVNNINYVTQQFMRFEGTAPSAAAPSAPVTTAAGAAASAATPTTVAPAKSAKPTTTKKKKPAKPGKPAKKKE